MATTKRPLSPVSLKGTKRPRFNFTTGDEITGLSEAKPPKTTLWNTKWALRNYESWVRDRNASHPDMPVPQGLLKTGNAEELDHWLSFYAAETRNCKGERYPPKTLYQLLTGLLRHARTNDQNHNFLDKTSGKFKRFHTVLDNIFKSLRQEGVGSDSKHTETISKDEENKLWDSGVMGTDSPKSLLRAVFYFNGKNFCLRGGTEHRNLKLSQFTRHTHPTDHYIYTENYSKNRQGGLGQLRIENKVVPIYSTAGARCHVKILDLYFSKLPKKRVFFYARPLPFTPTLEDKSWFLDMPVGKNVLGTMLKDMCADAKIPGHKTNHSLRATGASELFSAGVPEKIIKERTGHRSLEALRLYEHTTHKQQQAVSLVLGSEKETSFQEAIQSTYHYGDAPLAPLPQQPLPLPPQPLPYQYRNHGPQQVFNNCTVVFQGAAPAVSANMCTSTHYNDSFGLTENDMASFATDW